MDTGLTHVFANTRLAEELEKLKFSKGSQAEHRVIKRCDFFDCHFPPARPVYCGAYNAICTFAYDVKHLVLGTYDTHMSHGHSEKQESGERTYRH